MSSRVAYTYDPEDIILLIGGVPVKNFGSDSAVVISRDGNINEKQVGVLGEVTVNRMRDKTGTLTVTLKGQSEEDKMLDELQALDVYSFPVVLIVKSTNKQLITEGWLEEQPDMSFGTQMDDREHVIGLANSVPSLLEGAFNLAGEVQRIEL